MEITRNSSFANRYRLLKRQGSGSFGEVWLAHDEQTGIEVAVKIYIALDNRGIEEFRTEYKTAFALNHPHLLHANFFDVCEQRPYLVMQYCPTSAVSLIGQIDEQTVWRFIRDVADGLAYLHEQDVVHRDIKPDNILRDSNGRFLITDFGLSLRMRSTLRRNSTRQQNADNVAGTIGYMAPELFMANAEAVKATDIWALGATLYEMLTGELPFMGQGGVMQLHGAEVPMVKGEYSQALKDLISACLAKDTWKRPTAEKLTEGAEIKAITVNECRKPSVIHRKWFYTIFSISAILFILGFVYYNNYSNTPSYLINKGIKACRNKNFTQARKFYNLAAQQGDITAYMALSVLYSGNISECPYINIDSARYWFHMAENAGYILTQDDIEYMSSIKYNIGDIYNYGDKKGVVFSVDSTGFSGKIIGLKESLQKWSTQNGISTKTFHFTDGLMNTIGIQLIQGWEEKYPAFNWCVHQGGSWYLPSKEELELLMSNQSIINQTLSTNSYTLLNKCYWSSTSFNEYNAWYVCSSNSSGAILQTEEYYTRAVAKF